MSEPVLLSRKIDVSAVPADGVHERLVATESERSALAKEFGLIRIDSLEADLAIVPWQRDGFAVSGRVRAEIAQRCVVSLVPVQQSIDEEIVLHFVPSGSRLAAGPAKRDVVIDVSGEDPPEVFSGNAIDIGAAVAEHFALAIDPYPRAPGAVVPEAGTAGEGSGRADSPFAVLERLKKRGGGKS